MENVWVFSNLSRRLASLRLTVCQASANSALQLPIVDLASVARKLFEEFLLAATRASFRWTGRFPQSRLSFETGLANCTIGHDFQKRMVSCPARQISGLEVLAFARGFLTNHTLGDVQGVHVEMVERMILQTHPFIMSAKSAVASRTSLIVVQP